MESEIYKVLVIDPKDAKALPAQLSDQITWLIASGQLKPGDKLPTIRSLAEFLGINLHTVRSAYKRLEEQRLIRTRRGDGSTVLEFGAMMYATKTSIHNTNTVGIIVPSLGNPFYPELIRGVEEVASERNILSIACNCQENEEQGQVFLDMLVAKQVDGLILAPYGLNLKRPSNVETSGQPLAVPVVFVDRPGESGYCVLLDAEGAGYQATEHLIREHGVDRIAMITGNIRVPTLAQCYEGYRRALEENDCGYDRSLVIQVDEFSYNSGYQATERLMDLDHKPQAIFASGDMLAIGAIRALYDKGMQVPDDVPVVGYNNIEVAAYMQPRLTSVHAPAYELGVASMEMLYKLIQGEAIDQSIITLPTKLVVRDSCGCNK